MKNAAAGKVGSPAYLLITESAEGALDLKLADAVRFSEEIDGAATVGTVAMALGT
jgi:hypothetical protein